MWLILEHLKQYVAGLATTENYKSGIIGIVSNALYNIIALLCVGVAAIGTYFFRRYRKSKLRRRIAFENQTIYARRNMLVLSGSEFEIRNEDISTIWRIRDDFFFSFPETLRGEMSGLDPKFEFREHTESAVFSDLKSEILTVIPDFDDLVQTALFRAANIMLNRARNSNKVFNGFVFQAYDIVVSAINDHDENPTISLTVYRTDYFTLLALLETFRVVRDRENVKNQWADQKMPRKLRLLYTGIGLNIVVVAVDDRDGTMALLLRKRSARALKTSATGQWHVTANETLSMTEVEETRILLPKWIERALREEVGINKVREYFIFSCLLYLDDMQPGLNALVFCDFRHETLESMIESSKDGMLEYDATKLIPFDDHEIAHLLRGVPGVDEGGERVRLSAVAENMIRSIAARGVDLILTRVGFSGRRESLRSSHIFSSLPNFISEVYDSKRRAEKRSAFRHLWLPIHRASPPGLHLLRQIPHKQAYSATSNIVDIFPQCPTTAATAFQAEPTSSP
jgi:hypothetical protein